MRTQKRFTAALLRRFQREGRGTGTYEEYTAWHRVGRGDPASRGRSHLWMWRSRQRDLLSDVERVGHYFVHMMPNVLDSIEQFPHGPDAAPHEMSRFDTRIDLNSHFPGTLEIARRRGIRHFMLSDEQSTEPWRYSTDQLLLIEDESKHRSLLAIAYKPSFASLTKRDREKLSLDQEYWQLRSVPWLLVTPDVYDPVVSRCLEMTAPWAINDPVSVDQMHMAVEVTNVCLGLSLTDVLHRLSMRTGSKETAQRSFWQAVWCGAIPLDLRRGWRPHVPVRLLTLEQFAELNPIRSRRSAWN